MEDEKQALEAIREAEAALQGRLSLVRIEAARIVADARKEAARIVSDADRKRTMTDAPATMHPPLPTAIPPLPERLLPLIDQMADDMVAAIRKEES